MIEPEFRLKRVDKETGYNLMVVRHPELGHFCGYVQVPADHPWYKTNYHARHQELTKIFDIDPEPINKRIRADRAYDATHGIKNPMETDEPEQYIEVHGGITFAGFIDNETDWWFGFDCCHAGDWIPYMEEFNKRFDAEHPEFAGLRDNDRRWSPDDVLDECAKMALQIKKHATVPVDVPESTSGG